MKRFQTQIKVRAYLAPRRRAQVDNSRRHLQLQLLVETARVVNLRRQLQLQAKQVRSV